MKFSVLIVVCFLAYVKAYPQADTAASKPPIADFFNFLGELVVSSNLTDIPADVAKVPKNQLMNCVNAANKEAVEKTCRGTPSTAQPLLTAECVLVNLLGALNNATGQLNATVLKTTIESSTFSAAQKTAAIASLDSCLASDAKLPFPAVELDASTKERMKKYGERNCPMKIMFCLAKSLIQNGCSKSGQ